MVYIMDKIQKQFHIHEIDVSDTEYKNIRLQDYLKVDSEFFDMCIKEYYYRDYIDENTEVKSLWEQVEECIEETIKIKCGETC